MAKLIKPSLIDEYHKQLSIASKLEDQINNRVEYILRTIVETFGSELDCWYWDGAHEEHGPTLDSFSG